MQGAVGCGTTCLAAGKYDGDNLPKGPRAALFKQILPGAQPLLDVLQEVAERRGKTVPQVSCTTQDVSVWSLVLTSFQFVYVAFLALSSVLCATVCLSPWLFVSLKRHQDCINL